MSGGADPGRLALVGMGGVGKTALAVSWDSEQSVDFPDGEIFVDLQGFGPTPRVSAERALRRILVGLGVSERDLPDDLDALSAAYRSVLAGRRMIIVLDNATASDQLRPLLPGSTRSLSLVTNRNRLVELEVLDDVAVVEVDPLGQSESLELLNLTEDDVLGHRLAEACGGLPLALRIVAWRLRRDPESLSAFDPESTLDNLSVGQDMGMRWVLEWTYRALSRDAQRLFRLLAAVPGPRLRVELIARVARDHGLSTRLVQELLALHLLSRDNGTLYRHDLVTTYSVELAALESSAEERASARRSVLVDELQLVDAAVAATRKVTQLEASLSPGVLNHAFGTQSVALAELGDFDAALPLARRAIDVVSTDDPLYWFSRLNLASIHQMRGMFPPAAEEYRACLEHADVPTFAADLAVLNWFDDVVLTGGYKTASRLEERLMALDDERILRVGGPVRAVRAELALRRRDLELAEALAEEAAAWGREHHYRLLEIRTSCVLGMVDAHHGSTARLRAVLALTRRTHNQSESARTALLVIEGLRLVGKDEQAATLAAEVREACDRLGLVWHRRRLAELVA